MLKTFKIGNHSNQTDGTGVTVILAEQGAVGGVCVRGAAPATRETDLLGDGKTVQKLNAVVLSGGSAFGLEASCGVMQYLNEKNLGYNAGKFNVPIVAGASLYDLEFKNFSFPNKNAGYEACQNATEGNFEQGSIGAGTGATVSKVLGADVAAKGGLGVKLFSLNGIEIAVIVAVNAVGDIVKNGEIILGAQFENGSYVNCHNVFTCGTELNLKNQNTTIGCVLTNAKITKEQANILASLAHDGFALSLSPSHTLYDGDCMFVMSSGEKNVNFNMLCALVPNLTAEAIQSVAIAAPPTHKKVSAIMFKFFQKLWKNKASK
jgi:L-aminopeptidase/D-esterase-like protein